MMSHSRRVCPNVHDEWQAPGHRACWESLKIFECVSHGSLGSRLQSVWIYGGKLGLKVVKINCW